MLSFKDYLVEYITNPLIYFKNYINMPDDEKAVDAAYTFFTQDSAEEFFDELEAEYEDEHPIERPDELEDISDMTDDQIQQYGNWLMSDDGYKLAQEFGDGEMPSWYFFSNAKIVKNTWLIHVSRNVSNIVQDGFLYGVEDMARLGLTTYISDKHKKRKHNSDFYCFAFTPDEFRHWDGNKYGKDFVMFVSSGVEAYHSGDEENQTLFIAREARYFIPVYNEDGYTIYDKSDSGKVIHSGERPMDVVNWVMNNFTQYHNRIVQRERN